MDLPGSTTDYQSSLSALSTPIFSDNVQDLLGVGMAKNPSAIFAVNSTADVVDDSDGVTTLREAINFANANAGDSLIVFDRSVFSTAQTITLNLGELDITHNTSIIAPQDSLTGANLVEVSGNNASRVIEIETGATVTLSGLIVADGRVRSEGGGIKNRGTLTLDNSIVRNNFVIFGTFNTMNGGGIYNDNGASLTVNNSTISNNVADSYGGGIYNSNKDGIVVLSNSTISNNSVIHVSAGGIYNSGTLTVSNCHIRNNKAHNSGGGIYNSNNDSIVLLSNCDLNNNSAYYDEGGALYNRGTMNVSNSTINNNSVIAGGGGGISNRGIMTVSNSTLYGNSAYIGGGIYSIGGGIMTVSNSTISGDSAFIGGGIFNTSDLEVSNSTISGDSATGGGGIYNGDRGVIKVSNSTISGNKATDSGGGIYNNNIVEVGNSLINGNLALKGGGIYNSSTVIFSTNKNPNVSVKVSDSTISGNKATDSGGGIYNNNIFALVFSTLTLNWATNGGGIFNDSSGSTNVRNTIIAANLLNNDGANPDVAGDFISDGYNLIGDRTGSTGFDATGDIVGTSDNPIDPRLDALDFYGGSTATYALLPNSPAIDAAAPIILDTDPITDQRGYPRVSGARADIGAFEFSEYGKYGDRFLVS